MWKPALRGLLLSGSIVLGGLLAGCGTASDTISSPLAEWCTDPARDASGNGVLTLVKKPDASLPSSINVIFNDQAPVSFVDDGTGLDVKAGDGIYTHSVKLTQAPTTHSCNPVLEEPASAGAQTQSVSGRYGDYGALLQKEVSGSCSFKVGKCGCLAQSLGFSCVCVSCNITISF